MASKIRDRIVRTSVRCFAARGYSGSCTKEIAALARVTEGSVFRLFLSKEKLFTEALGVALDSKGLRDTHLRLAAFAMLERKGLSKANQKALAALAARSRLIRELRSIA